jgi:hypothetical protein
MATSIDFVSRQRSKHPTVWFALMRAVVKSTCWDMRVELRKPALDFFSIKVQQAKPLKARRIN